MPTILLTAKRLQSKSNHDKKHQNKNFVSSFLPSPPLRLLPPPFIPDKWLNLICSFDTSHLGLSELWHKSVLVWNGFLSKNWKKNIIKCSSVNSPSTAWRSNLSCLPSSFTAVPCLHSLIIPSHLRAPSSLLHSFCFTPPSIWACPSPSADSPLPPSSKCPIYKVGGNSEETVQCERYSRGSASHTPNSNATPSAALARSHISAVAVPLMADVTTQREEKNKQKKPHPIPPISPLTPHHHPPLYSTSALSEYHISPVQSSEQVFFHSQPRINPSILSFPPGFISCTPSSPLVTELAVDEREEFSLLFRFCKQALVLLWQRVRVDW